MRHLLGIDMDPRACVTYAANHGNVLCADISTVTYDQVVGLTKEATCDVLAASPPCQSFSVVGSRRLHPDPSDHLYTYVNKFAQWFQPRCILLENVPGMLNKSTVFTDILQSLQDIGYDHVVWAVLKAEDYGVPQTRHRVFVVAMKSGDPASKSLEFPPPLPVPPPSPQSLCIGNILQARETVQDPVYWMTPEKAAYYTQRQLRKGPAYVRFINPIHIARTVRASYYKSRGAEALVTYEDGAMRLLTEAEVSAIQTFPPQYQWRGSRTAIYSHIGNAVPPLLAKRVGVTIVRAVASGI